MAKKEMSSQSGGPGKRKFGPTKERILKIAAELFARNGFDATGIAELGDAVGLARGALYHHIESKEWLLFEISMRHMSAMADRAEAIVGMDLPAQDKLRRISRSLLSMIAHSQPEAAVTFRDARALSTDRAHELGEQRRRVEAAWVQVLEAGRDEGVFRDLHPVVVKGLWGMHVISYRWIDPDGDLSSTEIADVFCDVLLHSICAQPQAASDVASAGLQEGKFRLSLA